MSYTKLFGGSAPPNDAPGDLSLPPRDRIVVFCCFLDCLLFLEVFLRNLNQLLMGRASKQAHPFERLVQSMLPFPSSGMIHLEQYEQSKEAGLKLVRREGLVRSIEGSNQRTYWEFPQALLAST